MKEANKDKTSVWVVQPKLKSDLSLKNYNSLVDEAVALTKALPETNLLGSSLVSIDKLRPKEFFGKGKVFELTELFNSNKIHLVIINSQITPIQQRNLEKIWNLIGPIDPDLLLDFKGGDKIKGADYPSENTYGRRNGQDYMCITQYRYKPPRREQIFAEGAPADLLKGSQRDTPFAALLFVMTYCS